MAAPDINATKLQVNDLVVLSRAPWTRDEHRAAWTRPLAGDFVNEGSDGAVCTSEDGMKWAEFFSKSEELRMDARGRPGIAGGMEWS